MSFLTNLLARMDKLETRMREFEGKVVYVVGVSEPLAPQAPAPPPAPVVTKKCGCSNTACKWLKSHSTTSLVEMVQKLRARIDDLEGDLHQRNSKPGRSFAGCPYPVVGDMLEQRWQHKGLSRELREEMAQIIAELRNWGPIVCFQGKPL